MVYPLVFTWASGFLIGLAFVSEIISIWLYKASMSASSSTHISDTLHQREYARVANNVAVVSALIALYFIHLPKMFAA